MTDQLYFHDTLDIAGTRWLLEIYISPAPDTADEPDPSAGGELSRVREPAQRPPACLGVRVRRAGERAGLGEDSGAAADRGGGGDEANMNDIQRVRAAWRAAFGPGWGNDLRLMWGAVVGPLGGVYA